MVDASGRCNQGSGSRDAAWGWQMSISSSATSSTTDAAAAAAATAAAVDGWLAWQATTEPT